MKHFGFLLFSLAFIGLVIRVRVSKDQNFNIIFKPDTRQFLQQFFFIFLKLIDLIFYIFYLLILLTITIAFLNLLDLNLQFEVFINPFFFIWHQLHHFVLQSIEDFLLLGLLFSPSTLVQLKFICFWGLLPSSKTLQSYHWVTVASLPLDRRREGFRSHHSNLILSHFHPLRSLKSLVRTQLDLIPWDLSLLFEKF